MTKRSKKRTNRNGVGPLKPAPGPEGPIKRDPMQTLVEDNLDPLESLRLELRALRADWTLSDPNAEKLRQGLLNKILRLTIAEEIAGDAGKKIAAKPELLLKIFQTLSVVEQRQQRLDLQRLALLVRTLQPGKPPRQPLDGVNVTVNNNVSATAVAAASSTAVAVPQKTRAEIVRELLADSDIAGALMAGTS